jgi:hypothetical protein
MTPEIIFTYLSISWLWSRTSTRWGHEMSFLEGLAWPLFLAMILLCTLAVLISATAIGIGHLIIPSSRKV